MAADPSNTLRVQMHEFYGPQTPYDPDEMVFRYDDISLYFSFNPPIPQRLDGRYRIRLELHICANQSIYRHPAQAAFLEHADGIVFVADSQSARLEANIESCEALQGSLIQYGYPYNEMPLILQCNKRDMPDIVPIHKIQQLLDMQDRTVFESVAVRGVGVIESLKEVTRLILAKHRRGRRPPAAN
ncbi:gliding-motility protein MglA [Haliangium sp. UPWRP_2]|nr:gliding-motility protein MglA [Haliangium sp. UPWRP_2]